MGNIESGRQSQEWICLTLEYVFLTIVSKKRLKKPTLEQIIRKGLSEEVTFNLRSKDHLRQSILIRIH